MLIKEILRPMRIFLATTLIVLSGCQANTSQEDKQENIAWTGFGHVDQIASPAEGGVNANDLVNVATDPSQGTVVGQLHTALGDVPLRQVGVWADAAAQTEGEFVISLGRVMREMSATSGVEFCGQLCQKGSTWGIALTTIDSGLYCPSVSLCPGPEWEGRGQFIHSHRPAGELEASFVDQAVAPGKIKTGQTVTVLSDNSSELDRHIGGWIVGQKRLWYVNEHGQTMAVWDYVHNRWGSPDEAL